MMDLVALIFALAGFAGIALSMRKHHRDLFGKPPSRFRASAFTAAGWTLLCLSFGACIIDSGWAIGPVFWIGILTAAALIVVLSLSYGAKFVSGSRPVRRGQARSRHKGRRPLPRRFLDPTSNHDL